MAVTKDAKALARAAEKAGWRIQPTRGGHLKWLAPNGAIITSSNTFSEARGLKNHLALMRRLGGWQG